MQNIIHIRLDLTFSLHDVDWVCFLPDTVYICVCACEQVTLRHSIWQATFCVL